MSGSVIAYGNYVDSATLSTPDVIIDDLENLKTRQLAKYATIEGATFQVDVDLGIAKRIDFVGLLGLRGETYITSVSTGKMQAIGSVVISSTPTHDSPLFNGSWSAQVYADNDGPFNLFSVPAGITARYVRVTSFEPLPATALRSAGRLFIGPAVLFPDGFDTEWTIEIIDPGKLDSSAGGQWYESPRPRTRRLTFDITGIETEAAFGFGEDDTEDPLVPSIQRAAYATGATGEVIVLPRTSTGPWMNRIGIYGHFERPLRISHLSGPNYSTGGVVQEER